MEINKNAINAQIGRIETDYLEDCLPIISTVSNVYDVGQKIFYNMTMSSEEIKKDYYCDHICNKKSLLRSITLMVPVLGQIAVFSYDWAIGRGNGSSLRNATPEQQNDEVYVLQFLKNPPRWVQKSAYQGNPLLNDETFMLKAMSLYGPKTLYFASDALKETPSFLLKAIQQRPNDRREKHQFNRFTHPILEGAFGECCTYSAENTIMERIIPACKDNDEMLLLATEFLNYNRLGRGYTINQSYKSRLREKTMDFWKKVTVQNPNAIKYFLNDHTLGLEQSSKRYQLLKELENPQVFLLAKKDHQIDMIKLAEFFDESKILFLSDEQKAVVQKLKEEIQPERREHKKLLSAEAAKIYGDMINTNNSEVPQNTSEAVKEELQSYLEMTNVKDLHMTISSIIKSNFIDDLNKLTEFLKSEEMNDKDYDTTKSPVVADAIQIIANMLPKYLSDDDSQLSNNLRKVKFAKEKIVDALAQLHNRQIRDAYELMKTKNEPFLLQTFNVMDILKNR